MSNHKVTADGVEYVRSDKALKAALHKADAELIAALNGMGREVATDVEAADLRRALMRARADCVEAGVQAETLLEYSERTRGEDEAELRAYAMQSSSEVQGIDRAKRIRLASAVGCMAAVATVACFRNLPGLLAGAVVAVGVFGLMAGWLADRYPTLGVVVGKRAFECHLGVIELWPQGSDNAKDYLDAYRRLDMRARAAGTAPGWLKAR